MEKQGRETVQESSPLQRHLLRCPFTQPESMAQSCSSDSFLDSPARSLLSGTGNVVFQDWK